VAVAGEAIGVFELELLVAAAGVPALVGSEVAAVRDG